jgi:hypothetical protein
MLDIGRQVRLKSPLGLGMKDTRLQFLLTIKHLLND